MNIVLPNVVGCCVEKGDIFGWGNSEYDQLAVAKPQVTQVSHPTWLNFKDVGKVTKAASAGSMCLLLNGACFNCRLLLKKLFYKVFLVICVLYALNFELQNTF